MKLIRLNLSAPPGDLGLLAWNSTKGALKVERPRMRIQSSLTDIMLPVTSLLFGGLVLSGSAATFVVPGTSDPWLAGLPDGSLDNISQPEPPDMAPAQSPVFASAVTSGSILTWTATGVVGHPENPAGPDGAALFSFKSFDPNYGISFIVSPYNALLGVFLGPGEPDPTATPEGLLFSAQKSRDYTSLSPALQQVFFMGDGLTSGSLTQTIIAPAGATRLFLGTMDSFGWANNIGEFEVTIEGIEQVPDSTPYCWLMLVGLLAVSAIHRRASLHKV
jgi:hypothetical protein